MVKRCAYSICGSDNRYSRRTNGISFVPFPKPHIDREKAMRWIKACNRPHSQFNLGKITRNTYHFHGGDGPTDEYPDPISDLCRPTRKHRQTVRHLHEDIQPAPSIVTKVRNEYQGSNQICPQTL
uniref:uncharacterized protein LOC120336621 n=1 Tax=Styela clava TaxID=7725 RepID=UPI00193A8AF5|nr:uncharacterized protein LOC120336621 [Styela clava]